MDSYKKFAQLIDNFEELKSYGLTDNEIQFLNDYNKNADNISFKYKNLSTTALEQKLEYIFDLIEKGRNKTTIKTDNKLVHPINNLQQIHNDIFGHLNTKIVVPSLKKRRKRIKKYLETPDEIEITTVVNNTNKRTKWDVKTKEVIRKETYVRDNLKIVSETKDEKINVGGKPFVGWKPSINILSDCKKISVDEIKNLDRFKNYEIGKPSKVKTLFLFYYLCICVRVCLDFIY